MSRWPFNEAALPVKLTLTNGVLRSLLDAYRNGPELFEKQISKIRGCANAREQFDAFRQEWERAEAEAATPEFQAKIAKEDAERQQRLEDQKRQILEALVIPPEVLVAATYLKDRLNLEIDLPDRYESVAKTSLYNANPEAFLTRGENFKISGNSRATAISLRVKPHRYVVITFMGGEIELEFSEVKSGLNTKTYPAVQPFVPLDAAIAYLTEE